jgi:hypothetical protein
MESAARAACRERLGGHISRLFRRDNGKLRALWAAARARVSGRRRGDAVRAGLPCVARAQVRRPGPAVAIMLLRPVGQDLLPETPRS